MIIRSAEPRAATPLYWLIQAALLLILAGAMVIAGAALGNPRVIRSLLDIGSAREAAPAPRSQGRPATLPWGQR